MVLGGGDPGAFSNGTNGAGGGGGAFVYKEFETKDLVFETTTNGTKYLQLYVGEGGYQQRSGKGADAYGDGGDTRNGKDGIDGGNTRLEAKGTVFLTAYGGKGGGGGHRGGNNDTGRATPGYGGGTTHNGNLTNIDTTTNLVQMGNSGNNSTDNYNYGASSGYRQYNTTGLIHRFIAKPGINYGDGGNGTVGMGESNRWDYTGVGISGYARVIFY